jgi:hypothetical protein
MILGGQVGVKSGQVGTDGAFPILSELAGRWRCNSSPRPATSTRPQLALELAFQSGDKSTCAPGSAGVDDGRLGTGRFPVLGKQVSLEPRCFSVGEPGDSPRVPPALANSGGLTPLSQALAENGQHARTYSRKPSLVLRKIPAKTSNRIDRFAEQHPATQIENNSSLRAALFHPPRWACAKRAGMGHVTFGKTIGLLPMPWPHNSQSRSSCRAIPKIGGWGRAPSYRPRSHAQNCTKRTQNPLPERTHSSTICT